MNLDFHERVQALNTVDNHAGFYLASAGIERAREDLKLPDTVNWTTVLQGAVPAYPTDGGLLNPQDYVLLCPFGATKGCVIPRFQTTAFNPSISADGEEVSSDDDPLTLHDIPFTSFAVDGAFGAGHYSVRAFNDAAEPGTVDLNRQLTVRALGHVRGEVKVLEATARTVSCGLITCTGDSLDACLTEKGAPDLTSHHLDGCGPRALLLDQMPFLDPPLSDPSNLYRDPTHFGLPLVQRTGDMTLTTSPNPSKPEEALIQNNTYYYATGNILVKDTDSGPVGDRNIVIFSEGNVTFKTGTLTDAIIIGVDEVSLQGGATLDAPPTYPAIIAGTAVHADANVTIFGSVYSTGLIDLNPIVVHGAIIGQTVEVQGGNGTLYTDDGSLDTYELMQGFNYPEQSQQLQVTNQSWHEIQ